jgi:methyltransferase (TIGR00027 family)
MQDVLGRIPVLEVDVPANSRQKRLRLRRIGGLPDNLSLVGANFETADLPSMLEAGGYRSDTRTMFIWEGVSMFLTEAAVTETLKTFAIAAPTSAAVFDYILSSVVNGSCGEMYGARQAARYLASRAEPYLFGLEHHEVGPVLLRHGLIPEDSIPAFELAGRFLRQRNGKLLGRVNEFHGIAVARTPPQTNGEWA